MSLLTFYVQDAKVDVDPYVCNILLAGTQIVFTGVSMILVDRLSLDWKQIKLPVETRLGRRVLLVVSELIMCACLVAIGVYFFLKAKVNKSRQTHYENIFLRYLQL